MTRRRNARPPSSLRVCRPGGVIGMANWMPEGFGLDFFLPHAEANPPPPELASPLRWGTAEGLDALLGPGAEVTAERRVFHEHFRSTRHAPDEHNDADDGTAAVRCEYLQVVAVRR